MNDMSDFEVFEMLQNFATNKALLKMFSEGKVSDKDLDVMNQVLITCNRYGVSSLTVINILMDLIESGVFNAE